jgi:starvation-inducible DNA-binding protein
MPGRCSPTSSRTTRRTLRQDLEAADGQHHDMGTHDYLTGLMQRHEKMAWMVRAFLESKPA